MSEYMKYRIAWLLSRALPRPLGYWCGLRIADHTYFSQHHQRQAVIRNLRQIYKARGTTPSLDSLEGQARKTFQYFGKYLVDFFRFSRLSREEIDRLVSVQHHEYIQQAYDPARGLIMLTAHFGNWELGGALVAAMGYRINAVFLPQRLQKIDHLFRKQRARRGIHQLPLGHSASNIIRVLHRGELVALLGDRDFTVRDDRIPFFGKPARLPRGPARLSHRLNVPIVPAFLLRQVDDTFLARFHPPIYPDDFSCEYDIRMKICAVLEQEIGENPHQWFIFDDFWAEADRAQLIKHAIT